MDFSNVKSKRDNFAVKRYKIGMIHFALKTGMA